MSIADFGDPLEIYPSGINFESPAVYEKFPPCLTAEREFW